jgi:hypothetical protein
VIKIKVRVRWILKCGLLRDAMFDGQLNKIAGVISPAFSDY